MRYFIRALIKYSPLTLPLISAASTLTAQASGRLPAIDVPLLELPYNFAHGSRAPGMQQSLRITSGLYEATHSLLAKAAPRHPWLTNLGITVFDYVTIAVPLNDAWLHEEWHRAVLSQHAIGSRNDVWNLKNVFAEAISVSHVTDEDLIRFKRASPQDFVRMKAAGYEGEGELITRLETSQFFTHSQAWHVGLYWLVALNDQLYVGGVVSAADSAEIDDQTDKANRDERTIPERDVSGHDFTAWVYHLFRPDEAFEARGSHPSGVGIDRYIKVADLSAEEKKFLQREGRLAWLNFVDPNFIGVRSFNFRNPIDGEPARVNAWLRHSLTSFGHSIDAHVVFSKGNLGVHAIAQRFTNHERSFPGLRVALTDLPIRIGTQPFALSPSVGVWAQPRDQDFRTRESSLGGLAGLRIATAGASRFNFYVEAEAKTAGWVAGRPSLGHGATLMTGFTFALSRGAR